MKMATAPARLSAVPEAVEPDSATSRAPKRNDYVAGLCGWKTARAAIAQTGRIPCTERVMGGRGVSGREGGARARTNWAVGRARPRLVRRLSDRQVLAEWPAPRGGGRMRRPADGPTQLRDLRTRLRGRRLPGRLLWTPRAGDPGDRPGTAGPHRPGRCRRLLGEPLAARDPEVRKDRVRKRSDGPRSRLPGGRDEPRPPRPCRLLGR